MAAPGDNCDTTEKAVDSLYSNSFNSESTRSNSFKSALRSGSNSSGSSGYGGKPSSGSSGASKCHTKRYKEKDSKKEITEIVPEPSTSQVQEAKEDTLNNLHKETYGGPANKVRVNRALPIIEDQQNPKDPENQNKQEDFSCVVSMQNGVIMYSTATLRKALGYPLEMLVGRSFIDFVHPRDQGMFASHISSIQELSPCKEAKSRVFLYCRLRRYNGLSSAGFEIKTNSVAYLPFKLVLSFSDESKDCQKDIEKPDKDEVPNDKESDDSKLQGAYIVVQANTIVSAFKASLEILSKKGAFTLRHSVLGVIEHIDASSIPYLGYMPHDLLGRCAIKMYHPEDLCYMRRVYETVLKMGQAPKTSFRMLTQNGDYVRVETKFTCFVNPWSRKLEYITGHHEVIQGPCDVDVFGPPDAERSLLTIKKVRINAEIMRKQTLRIMSECLTKRAEDEKQQMSRRCQNISSLMDKFMKRPEQDVRMDWMGNEHSFSEKGSEMLGGISPHHDYNDSNSGSTDTSPSYNQMNYKGILQKFFDSEPITHTAHNEEELEDRTFRPDCLSPSASSVRSANIGVPANESDEDDATMFHVDNNKDRTRPRLTAVALKKHDHEMEAILAKESRETRYRPERKVFSRQRLEHIARCNEYSDNKMTSAVITPMQQKFLRKDSIQGPKRAGIAGKRERSHNKQSSKRDTAQPSKNDKSPPPKLDASHNSKRDTSHNSKHDTSLTSSCDTPKTSKRDTTQVTKRPHDGKHTYLESSQTTKQGVKRDMMTAAMVESNRPHKQTKTLERITLPLPSVPFIGTHHAELDLHGDRSFFSVNITTNTFVNTISPSMGRQIRVPTYSTAFMPPVRSSQNNTNTSAITTSTPLMSARQADSNRCRGGKLPLIQDAVTSSGLYQPIPMFYLRDTITRQPVSNSNIVPLMLYPHGQQYVYAAVHTPAVHTTMDFQNVSELPNNIHENIKPIQQCSDDSSWNLSTNNEPNSGSDQDTMNKTDGETSSSFYSSFLKMDSSGDDQGKSSSDQNSASRCRTKCMRWVQKQSTYAGGRRGTVYPIHSPDKIRNKKKMEPPWLQEVLPTSDLFFRYKVPQKKGEEVLKEDQEFLENFHQSEEVNNQLGQLYMDLHLQGVTSRLTLEEGLTSSSSSGEETTPCNEDGKKKRPYSKMAMIFEEDLPFPPPTECLFQTHCSGTSLATEEKEQIIVVPNNNTAFTVTTETDIPTQDNTSVMFSQELTAEQLPKHDKINDVRN